MDNGDVGAKNLVYEPGRKLQITDILSKCGFNQKQINISLGTVFVRLLCPGNEVLTCNYLRNKNALDEVMDVDFSGLSKTKLYEISDLLLKHKAKIETQLFEHEKTLLQFSENSHFV